MCFLLYNLQVVVNLNAKLEIKMRISIDVAKKINQSLIAANHPRIIYGILQANTADFLNGQAIFAGSAVNISTALHRLAMMCYQFRHDENLQSSVKILCATTAEYNRENNGLRDFKPQEIANSLWALATLGVDPGRDELARGAVRALMAKIVERDGLRYFKPQDIANILWAATILAELTQENAVVFIGALEKHDLVIEQLSLEDANQLITFFYYCKFCLRLDENKYAKLKQFVNHIEQSGKIPKPDPSHLHREVMVRLRPYFERAVKFEREKYLYGYFVDEYFVYNGKGYVIEVNGPHHFNSNARKLRDDLKRKVLRAVGITVLEIDLPTGDCSNGAWLQVFEQQLKAKSPELLVVFEIPAISAAPILASYGGKRDVPDGDIEYSFAKRGRVAGALSDIDEQVEEAKGVSGSLPKDKPGS
jgi:very-short-patch-repair endonuclease